MYLKSFSSGTYLSDRFIIRYYLTEPCYVLEESKQDYSVLTAIGEMLKLPSKHVLIPTIFRACHYRQIMLDKIPQYEYKRIR